MAPSWEKFVEYRSELVKNGLFSESFNDPLLLISALTRSAFVNEHRNCSQLVQNGTQDRFHTLGDKILDFVIFDHFSQKSKESPGIRYSPEQFNRFREIYGKNEHLHKFSKDVIKLQEFVIWGPDEKKEPRKRWEESDTVLAHLFEALIGAIYVDMDLEGVKRFIEEIQFFEIMTRLFNP